MSKTISFVSIITLLSACTVGPDYKRPATPALQAPWIGPATAGPVNGGWWKSLNDPALDRLVETALAANLDIVEAEARLREARANRDAVVGGRLPVINASGSAKETGQSENGQIPVGKIPAFDRNMSLFDIGFDASWEIDLWGGTQRNIEAAEARGKLAEARRNDTRLRIVAEVVRTYAELRAAQAKLASMETEAALRSQIAELHEKRFKAGETGRDPWLSALQRVDRVRANMAGVQSQFRAGLYNLALLSGRPPEDGVRLVAGISSMPVVPEIVATGIRSEILQRRPDIRAADADLAAAVADVGAAKAQLYPRFSILGSLGQQGRSPGDLGSAGSTRFSIGPSFSWPIFSAARLKAQVRGSEARAEMATARYNKAVLGALTDSETALNRLANSRNAGQQLDAALLHTQQLAELARQRFQRGEEDKIQWLEAQSVSEVAEQSSLDARASVLSAYVMLCKALGGGWDAAAR